MNSMKKVSPALLIAGFATVAFSQWSDLGTYMRTGDNIAIGTTTASPKSKTDIKGNLTIGGTYGCTNAAPSNGMIVEGAVGIGTTTPASGVMLDVNGTIKSGSALAYGTPAISGYTASSASQANGVSGMTKGSGTYSVGVAGLELSTGTYNIAGWFWSQGTSGNRYGVLAFANGGSHSYPTGQWAGAFMGNTFVEKDLQVNGKIKIGNTWSLEAPDYVFNDSYNLRSLNEVEKYIDENKHLPEIPSAAQIKKDGVDLVEMNMTLLKKVEELTLYVIEQNKKIEALDAKSNQ